MIPQQALRKLPRQIERLEPLRYMHVAEVPLEAAETMEHFRTPPEDLGYAPAPVESRWGENWNTVWFRGTITIPESCKGKRVFYRHGSVAERLLFIDGVPFNGMDPYHSEALLTSQAAGGEQFRIHVEAYTGHPVAHANPYAPKIRTLHCVSGTDEEQPPLRLRASEIVVEREAVTGLYFDARTLLKTAQILDEDSRRRALLLDGLAEAMALIPPHWDSEEELEGAAQAARDRLAPLLTAQNGPSAPRIGLVGHAHIDVAWLWPLRETTRKTARTFSTMIQLMEEYPELRFIQSQPYLYEEMEQHYPELMEPIKALVKEGRWEPNGGMWVEADCNVPSGESLVRQFLEGILKTEELFGYRPDTLWLPDVFGYSAAIPQILKGCGIDHFVTNKITWNEVNLFPYSTFWWEGIDGSTVLSQFITTRMGCYNAQVNPEVMLDAWHYAQQKESLDATLATVGWGDGGGGVTREMCEVARRIEDLEGCPRTDFVNVSEFLSGLREQDVERPRWVGELYFEMHRGTYTTQARTKKYNRKLELLLHDVELFSAMAMPFGLEYPAEALKSLWRTVLVNQFHDILPGSSIPQVYKDAEAAYAEVEAALLPLRAQALEKLGAQLAPAEPENAWLIANGLSWDRDGLVVIEAEGFDGVVDAQGNTLPCQGVNGGVAVQAAVPALGVSSLALRKSGDQAESPFAYSGNRLETPHYRAAFDGAGRISSLVDKAADREIARNDKPLNAFYTADDMPRDNDAWDIDLDYRKTLRFEERLESREVVEDGPLFMTIRSTYAIGRRSSLTQDMTFYANSKRIDFITQVDWREKHTMLKVGFGLDIHTDSWRNEIQFGHLVRSTHTNTSWDQARFEVCAHKWVDLSEGDYGVALLNDCKYGHDCLDKMISLTLLKSPLGPDEQADQGEHSFAYALYPHRGDFSVASVVREAHAFNAPLVAAALADASGSSTEASLCRVSNPNVLLDTVKRAEDGKGLILRFYEAGKTRGPVEVAFPSAIQKAEECNLLEERTGDAEFDGGTLRFRIKPFEIKTFRVKLWARKGTT